MRYQRMKPHTGADVAVAILVDGGGVLRSAPGCARYGSDDLMLEGEGIALPHIAQKAEPA